MRASNIGRYPILSSDRTTAEELVDSLDQSLFVDSPADSDHLELYEHLQSLLRQDAFLRYVSETDDVYRVQTADGLELVVPKVRAVPALYPPSTRSPLYPAARYFIGACVGLPLAGFGTLLCAPVAVALAIRARRQLLGPADHTRIRVLILCSSLLWCIAIAFFAFFLMHLGLI
jgi:hypothetical protein